MTRSVPGSTFPISFAIKRGYKGRSFDSVVPPPMYFQKLVSVVKSKDFICKTILTQLAEGSIKWLGRVGVDPPPRFVNALCRAQEAPPHSVHEGSQSFLTGP